MAPEEDSEDIFGAEYERREYREMCELFGFDVTPPGTPEEPAAAPAPAPAAPPAPDDAAEISEEEARAYWAARDRAGGAATDETALCRARARGAIAPVERTELGLAKDQRVVVLRAELAATGWVFAAAYDGASGYVPRSYLKPVAPATAPAAAEDAAAAWSLEERAARRDAAAAAADADASPLAEVSVVTAVGTLRVDNAALYMPVERGEQVTSANLAIAAARADLEAADPAVVVDVGFEERDGYVSGGALAGDPALGQLWYGTRPLSEANEAAVVDVMLVYGSGAAFAIEGGYTTVRLPSAVEDLYKATLYLGVKRGGEGRRWAEGRATRGAARYGSRGV